MIPFEAIHDGRHRSELQLPSYRRWPLCLLGRIFFWSFFFRVWEVSADDRDPYSFPHWLTFAKMVHEKVPFFFPPVPFLTSGCPPFFPHHVCVHPISHIAWPISGSVFSRFPARSSPFLFPPFPFFFLEMGFVLIITTPSFWWPLMVLGLIPQPVVFIPPCFLALHFVPSGICSLLFAPKSNGVLTSVLLFF